MPLVLNPLTSKFEYIPPRLVLNSASFVGGGGTSYSGYPAALAIETDSNLYWQLVIKDSNATTDHFGIVSFSDGTYGFQSELYATTGTSVTFGPRYFVHESNARGTGAITGKTMSIGRNTSGSGAAGALSLFNRSGSAYYIWPDATGALRIGTSQPTEDNSVSDTSGTKLALSTDLAAYLPLAGGTMTGAITSTLGSLSSDTQALNITATYNNAAVAFGGVIKANITDTASNAASLFADFQVDGTSKLRFRKDGAIQFGAAAENIRIVSDSSYYLRAYVNNKVGWQIDSSNVFGINALAFGGYPFLYSTSNGVLEQRNTTTAQRWKLFNTYTDASNGEWFAATWSGNILTLGNEAAGTGTLRQLTIKNGSSSPKIDMFANADMNFAVPAAGSFQVTAASVSSTSGTKSGAVFASTYAPTSTSTLVGYGLQITPTINYSNVTPGAGSYEALKIAVTETALPTGTCFLIRASAGASGTTDKFTVTNGGTTTWADAANLVFGTSTGTKVATSTSQKLGFWNATPIVQPTTAVTAATRVAGVGASVLVDDTYDGYTLAQIVKALRNAGLLA